MLVLIGPQICEKKIKYKTLRAMTDDNVSVNNDDDGRQLMQMAQSTFGSGELQIPINIISYIIYQDIKVVQFNYRCSSSDM